MSELVKSWEDDETLIVENELQKLFVLHDRNVTVEKRSIFLTELKASGITVKAVIAGLKKLQVEDLKNIKLATIFAAAREQMDPKEAGEIFSCIHCDGTGKVLMKDAGGSWFSLACNCKNGWRGRGLARWNGDRTQESRGRVLTLVLDTVTEAEKAATRRAM